MKRVFIIDDHPLTRKGLVSLIEAEANLSVCGLAAGEKEALERIEAAAPDLMVLDFLVPGMRGLGIIEHLHARWPRLPILVFTDRTACALRALQAGAHGYVSKKGEEKEVVHAIRHLLAGKIYVSDAICDRLLLDLVSEPPPSPAQVLSRRELEVFELIGRGLDTGSMAEKLDISPKTIDSYRRRIRSKLNLEANAELIQRAVRWVSGYEVC